MKVFTDGSCLGNPGSGGFGAIGIENDDEIIFQVSGCEKNTTNNIMELKGAIHGIKKAKEYGYEEFTIYTDSNYVMKGITEWIEKWIKNNWRASNGKEVKNKELWKRLYELKTPKIQFIWVKAHNGNKWNGEVDKLARTCATTQFSP